MSSILLILVLLGGIAVLAVLVIVIVKGASGRPGPPPPGRVASAPGAAPVGSPPAEHDERLRVEARAVLDASGWHSAEAFLRERRGLSAEAARAVLDRLGPV